MEKSKTTKALGLFEWHRASWQQVVWACLFMAGAGLANRLLPPGASLWLRLVAVIGPLIPGVLYVMTTVRKLRGCMDEMQQKIFIESIAMAFAGTFLFAVLYPTIRKAGFISEPPYLDFAEIMLAVSAVSYLITKVRYR